jgi:hypothetical protein
MPRDFFGGDFQNVIAELQNALQTASRLTFCMKKKPAPDFLNANKVHEQDKTMDTYFYFTRENFGLTCRHEISRTRTDRLASFGN